MLYKGTIPAYNLFDRKPSESQTKRKYLIETSVRDCLERGSSHPLTGQPLEIEGLSDTGINRIVSNIAKTISILSVVHSHLRIDIQNSVCTAWAVDGRSQVELITVDIVGSIDRSLEGGSGLVLNNLALEVVNGVVISRHVLVELIVSSVIDVDNGERESLRNMNIQSCLAVLAIFSDRNTRASTCSESAECDGDGSVIIVQKVESRAGWASRTVDSQASDVERGRGVSRPSWDGDRRSRGSGGRCPGSKGRPVGRSRQN